MNFAPFLLNPYRFASAGDGPPVAGPEVWWDASDETTITKSGNAVTAMTDKSGNGYNLAPRSTGPDSGTRTINSLNVLDFVSGELLETTLAGGSLLTGTGTSFVVAAWDTGASGAPLFEGDTTNATERAGLQANGSPGSARHNWTTAAGSFDMLDDGALDTNPHIWTLQINGTSRSLWLDAGTPVSDVVSLGGLSMNRLAIGGYPRSSPAFYWDGAIAEVLIYTSALSSGDIDTVESYLATKWGITI